MNEAYNLEHVSGKSDTTGTYLFIDGASFHKTILNITQSIGIEGLPQIDFDNLSRWYERVFYYDCVPCLSGRENRRGLEEKAIYDHNCLISALETMPKCMIFTAPAKYSRKRMVQKQVDVKIAVDMMMHASMKNMRRCTLVTGDSDFIPLLEALSFLGVYVEIHYPQEAVSMELLKKAASSVPIDRTRFFHLISSDFKKKHGITHETLGIPERKDNGVYVRTRF